MPADKTDGLSPGPWRGGPGGDGAACPTPAGQTHGQRTDTQAGPRPSAAEATAVTGPFSLRPALHWRSPVKPRSQQELPGQTEGRWASRTGHSARLLPPRDVSHPKYLHAFTHMKDQDPSWLSLANKTHVTYNEMYTQAVYKSRLALQIIWFYVFH